MYYLAISFQLTTGHNQATVQEHECIQKLSTIRQEISHFTVKIYLNCLPNIILLKSGKSSISWYLVSVCIYVLVQRAVNELHCTLKIVAKK
jgi:hypothetical protein